MVWTIPNNKSLDWQCGKCRRLYVLKENADNCCNEVPIKEE